jgi:phosphohistidine phosphatase
MKTIYLVRHAKSSWEEEGLSDFDRPLNSRGVRDAPRMGKRLKEKHILPDLILSSPANRAVSTCRAIASILLYNEDKIKTTKELYHADEDDILAVIATVDDSCNSLMLFGHNPGLTDFANSLSENNNLIRNIPTCGVVCFTFAVDTWKKIVPGTGKFVFFDFPKSKSD